MTYHGGPLDYSFKFNNYFHPSLVCAFDMSTKTPGGLLRDMTGNQNHGTIHGNPAYVPPLISAKGTKAMEFDGSGDYVAVPNVISGLTDFTIVVWINAHSLGAAANCVWSQAGAAGNYLFLYSTLIRFYLGAFPSWDSKQYPVNNKTYMIALTRDSAGMGVMHLNGVFEMRAPGTPAPVVDANAYIGQYWNGGNRWDGVLDNMLFFDIALTPDQIWSIYRSAHPR